MQWALEGSAAGALTPLLSDKTNENVIALPPDCLRQCVMQEPGCVNPEPCPFLGYHRQSYSSQGSTPRLPGFGIYCLRQHLPGWGKNSFFQISVWFLILWGWSRAAAASVALCFSYHWVLWVQNVFIIYWMLCLECSDGFFIEHSSNPLQLLVWCLSRDGPQLCPSMQSSPRSWRNPSLFQDVQNYSRSCQGWLCTSLLRWEIRAHFTAQGLESSSQGNGWATHRITATLRVGNTSKMIESSLPWNSTVLSNPNHKVPHPLVFSTLPVMVTAPLPWIACSKA